MDNSNGNEKNFKNIYKRLIKLSIINEVSKISDSDKENNSKLNSNLSYFNFNGNNEIRNLSNLSTFDEIQISQNRELEVNDLFSMDENIENIICPFWDISKISITNNNQYLSNNYNNNNYNNNNYNNNFQKFQNPFKSNNKSINPLDEVYSLDFQGRYFIEK
jgi:hypothetical protein